MILAISVAFSICVSLAGCGDDGGVGTAACDTEPVILMTSAGVEFVRTPDACFDDLPNWPYEPNYVEIDGLRQAYAEAGPADGPVVLLLHGQPSWSYLYRKMIPILAEAGYRTIAMDHLGCGRSDKPIDIDDYTYLGHNERLEKFIEALELRDINLFVQDWGSLIGLRVAGLNPDWFASIAVGNGALPIYSEGEEVFPPVENPNEIIDLAPFYAGIPDQQVPFYDACERLFGEQDNSYFGNWMEFAMKSSQFVPSGTVEAQTWFPISEEVEMAYDAPFPSRIYMAGIRKFPSLVNEVPGTTLEAWAGLSGFEKPFVTIWAANDPGQMGGCEAAQVFIDNVPGAVGQPHTRIPEASHFLQDDQGEEIAMRLVDFYEANGIAAPENAVGFELLEAKSASELVVWVSQDITEAEFDAIELPDGWIKNQPRESDPDAARFLRSPDASEDGPLLEAELFGYTWQQNATVIETGIQMDDEGLLEGNRIAKYHEVTYNAGEPVYLLFSPEGDYYIRVSRDANRTQEDPTIPAGWVMIEHVSTTDLIFILPNPTLNIRADNEDSFQGPLSAETLGLGGGDDNADAGDGNNQPPLELTAELCEDPSNIEFVLEALQDGEGGGMFGGANLAQLERMLAAPTEGPFYMVNLIRYREWAEYPDGRETDLTGREANALYSPVEFLTAIGARVVFMTEVDNQIDGDDILWDDFSVVEYPCPLAFFAMLSDHAFQDRAVHKEAGVDRTISIITDLLPIPAPVDPDQSEAAFPPTNEDPAFDLIHVMDFHDIAQYEPDANEPERTGKEAWQMYQASGQGASADLGHYSTAALMVQGVFIGDERTWDEIQIVHMSSMAGFQALLDDDTREAGSYHRHAALQHNYSMITFPTISQIPYVDGNPGVTDAIEVASDGTGTPCSSDLDCHGLKASSCLIFGGQGFCTVEGCGAGDCEAPYLCCHDCNPDVAAMLPFVDSACIPGDQVEQLTVTPVSCTCD
jgi:pimeloyl-ACP methyl ester carboxylesterase